MKMNKKILLIVFLVLLSNTAFMQELSGEIKYVITHDWIKKLESDEFISDKEKQRYDYVWGNNSEWTEFGILKFNPQASFYEEIEDKINQRSQYAWKQNEYLIFRDYQKMMTYDVKRILGKLYVIEDTIQYQKWRILNDMREIAGHICMNAEWHDTIRDKRVIAWFALDIPISIGPERYGGLPGLILALNMNNGGIIITAEEIKLFEEPQTIEKPKHKRRHIVITEEEYNQIIYDFIAERRKMEQSYFWWGGVRF
jgi:GLPGLI family protein